MQAQPTPIPRAKTPWTNLVAGPCSAESEAQVRLVAQSLASMGVKTLRAGLWKPRTRAGLFEGVGETGLPWIVGACRDFGLQSMIEVGSPRHVEAAIAAGVDRLWIGARTTSCPFLVAEIARSLSGSGRDIFVKNPISPDMALWLGAIERFEAAGCRPAAIHRGVATFAVAAFRNFPAWWFARELRRLRPEMTMLCDPSHIAGRRDMVAHVAYEAAALGFDGYMIEVHPDPDGALTDAAQQLSIDGFRALIDGLMSRGANVASLTESARSDLARIRDQIARRDHDLLDSIARRLALGIEAARVKRSHGLPLYDDQQHQAMVARVTSEARSLGLDAEFALLLGELLHEETLKCQTVTMARES